MYTPMPEALAKQKLAMFLEEGRVKSQTVIQTLMTEAEARRDVMVSRDVMTFNVSPKEMTLNVNNPQLPKELGFTPWSEDQVLGTLKVPQKFVQGLQADGATGAAIATQVLNDLRYRIGGEGERNGKSRRLLRVVDDTVKGWLSDTYGVIDQSELLRGFTKAISRLPEQNVYLTGGEITDRRYFVSAMKAEIISPWAGEYIVVGGDLQSSDYGFGAVDFVQKVIRLVCRNGMIGVSFFRKVHHGGQLGNVNEAVFELSDRTRHLSAAATVSLLTDGVRGAFGQTAIQKIVKQYQEASVKEINPEAAAKNLREKGILGKDDAEKVPALMQQDVEFLPQTPNKNSALRFSQLLSWMAQAQPDGEKSIALMEASGKLVLS